MSNDDPYRAKLVILIQELAEYTGVAEMTLDETGKCCFVFDDTLTVWLEHNDGDPFFTLAHELGVRPEGGGFDKWALENNFALKQMGDVYVALDAVTQVFELVRRVPIEGLEFAGMQAAIEGFIEAMEKWRQAYAEAVQEAEAQAAETVQTSEPPSVQEGFGQFV